MDCPPVTACDLITPILIQRNEEDDDGQGGQTDNWTTIEEPWAKVKEGSGREFKFADQRKSTISFIVWLRYTDITERDRLVIDGKNVNIAAVEDWNRRRMWIKVTCIQGEPT